MLLIGAGGNSRSIMTRTNVGELFAAHRTIEEFLNRRHASVSEGLCAPLARSTIRRGWMELADGDAPDRERVRRAGGGRKPLSTTDASLIDDLRSLVSRRRAAEQFRYINDQVKAALAAGQPAIRSIPKKKGLLRRICG